MLFKFAKIYLISFIIPLIFSSYVYDSSSVIDYISKPVLDEYTYRVLKRSFALVFEDAYAYNEIATNPPQPYFDNNYHQKVDISQFIKKTKQNYIRRFSSIVPNSSYILWILQFLFAKQSSVFFLLIF